MDTAVQYYTAGCCQTPKTALLCLKVPNLDPILLLLKSVIR
jgi:hypothetical protein